MVVNPLLPNLKIVTRLPNPRGFHPACKNICSVAKCCDYLVERVTSKCGNTALKNSSYFHCTKAKLWRDSLRIHVTFGCEK